MRCVSTTSIIITAALIRGAISTPSVVQFWAYSGDCNGGQGGAATVAYIPDCSGHCYVYEDFYSVMLYTGGGLPGFGDAIDCAFYSDNNCQNVIPGHDHDRSTGLGLCHNFGGSSGKSMKCYAGC
ncbi:hypothetical protein FDECE_1725 [Fusarium decemcellulare]|nr:hypothetical protein FDECE_1725 [Fusarium decemcellulare]